MSKFTEKINAMKPNEDVISIKKKQVTIKMIKTAAIAGGIAFAGGFVMGVLQSTVVVITEIEEED